MGFLDIFKKKDNNVISHTTEPQKEDLPFRPNLKITPDGYWQLDFHDENADFKNFYDTTRLVINPNPVLTDGQGVYRCMVSWYGQNDCSIIDPSTGEYDSPRATEYSNIFTQIDFNLLQTDEAYYKLFMKGLLDKKRVERYLNDGLQENPQCPCGEYIGGVAKTNNGYKKYFNTNIGTTCHNSSLMVHKRQQYRENLEASRQKAIQAKRDEIARLQSDIDAMQSSQR